MLPITSIIAIALDIYKAIMDSWLKMLELMTPEQRKAYMDIVVEREKWWQDNVWDKIGDLLDGPEEPPA